MFRRSADLAYATFDDLAVFEGMRFLGKADFTSARFRAMARLGNTRFCAAASFADASFSHESVFSHADFDRADFTGVVFAGPADFRHAAFGPTADFNETTFAERADFSQISVPGKASFVNAHFGAGASFGQALLGQNLQALLGPGGSPALAAAGRGPRPLLLFDNASIGGPLTLKGASLFGGVQLNSVSARAIVVEQAAFDSTSALYMSNVSAGALSISPDELAKYLRALPAQRLAALRVVEATAKADGDLGRANDARYQIQVLESADDSWPRASRRRRPLPIGGRVLRAAAAADPVACRDDPRSRLAPGPASTGEGRRATAAPRTCGAGCQPIRRRARVHDHARR